MCEGRVTEWDERGREIGRVQHMAQEWVEALTTELLIMVLVRSTTLSRAPVTHRSFHINTQQRPRPLPWPARPSPQV
eukprot:256729-Rhodomonas_salina.1